MSPRLRAAVKTVHSWALAANFYNMFPVSRSVGRLMEGRLEVRAGPVALAWGVWLLGGPGV